MSSPDLPRHPWPAPLAGRVAPGADAVQVAQAVAALWLQVDEVLNPVIGRRGVAALYNRSLQLAAAGYPWMAVGHLGLLAAIDTDSLEAALALQPVAEAGAGGSALFQSLQTLLASLIGPALTKQLLGPVWVTTEGAMRAPDNLP